MVWFESPVKAVYRGDPAQTAAITHPEGWQTLGDVGYLDDDGYLFLTDRWTHKIVTGGVNVFPREVEDVLLAHPRVLDVAVIGVPDDEMGESVRAVVEPVSWDDVGPALADELITWTRARLADYKCPRVVRLRTQPPPRRERQALQAGAARPLLGRTQLTHPLIRRSSSEPDRRRSVPDDSLAREARRRGGCRSSRR